MYVLLSETGIANKISGSLYRGGMRPKDSDKEDLVIIFTTADGQQVQSGVITLNLYVPFMVAGTGTGIEDIARCEKLETVLQDALVKLSARKSNYLFSLKEAIHTRQDQQIGQSFIVARLDFRFFGKVAHAECCDCEETPSVGYLTPSRRR